MNQDLVRKARVARAALQSGALRGAALWTQLLAVSPFARDAFTDELLGFSEPPPDIANLPPGAVPYWPCEVDEILAMVKHVPLRQDDELVDLGAGLGRVVILAHLLSGARACGIEIQAPLVKCAKAYAEELALHEVTFFHADAADVALDGSVFFLYAPFNGKMMTQVLGRLHAVARRRPIVLCAVGLEFPKENWLRRRQIGSPALSLYDSCVPGVPCRETETEIAES